MTTQKPLIIALDVPPQRALEIIEVTADLVDCYKIGPQLLLHPDGWRTVLEALSGQQIFLDLKLADTRDTTAAVMERCAGFEIAFLSMTARPDADQNDCPLRGQGAPKLLAVLALSDRTWQRTEFMSQIDGYDGVICPFGYVEPLRSWGLEMPIFCPGIRMPDEDTNNHVARVTPGQAIAAGADYVIMGRPITQAADPRAAVQAVLDDIAKRGDPVPA